MPLYKAKKYVKLKAEREMKKFGYAFFLTIF